MDVIFNSNNEKKTSDLNRLMLKVCMLCKEHVRFARRIKYPQALCCIDSLLLSMSRWLSNHL